MSGPPMSERDLQASILKLARLCGWLAYHTHDSRRSEPGFPDLVMVRDKRVLFVEIKSATGRLSVAQSEWLERLRDSGKVGAVVWRPADWQSGTIERALR